MADRDYRTVRIKKEFVDWIEESQKNKKILFASTKAYIEHLIQSDKERMEQPSVYIQDKEKP